MTESFRATPPEHQWAGSTPGNGHQSVFGSQHASEGDTVEVGRVLLVGVVGGVLSAVGYLIYQRLPEDQKDKINSQVRTVVQQRITEFRQTFNI